VAPSGGEEKNLNMGAQLRIIFYKKNPKHFLKIARLNSISVCTNGGIVFRFWHYLYELDSFCGTQYQGNKIVLYGCTSAIHEVISYGRTFLSARFMAEVVRTNFAPIFSDFENFLGHSGTNRSAT